MPRPTRLVVLVSFIAVVAVLLGAVLTAAGAGGMKLTATPSSAAAGATVRIDGTGFAGGATGHLTWDGSQTGMPAYTASSSGSFSVNITVPLGAAAGAHTVAANGLSGGSKKPRNLATTTVTVPGPTATPRPTPTPTTPPTPTPVPTPTGQPTPTPAPVTLLAAGDIASCSATGDSATAAVLAGQTGTVITLGDNAYEAGTSTEFTNCYDPTWGQQKSRTKPAPGNHEYGTAGASGYFGYFGSVAGDPTKGYYAYNLGAWRIYSMNSNCSSIGGCGAGSTEETWLRADLAANPHQCVLAYWHHPRFSSGEHGSDATYQPFWQALYDYNADLVLVGHDHDYERFAPQSPSGAADVARGIREFVVGTGGRSHYAFPGVAIANSEARNDATFGILKLTLGATGYSWQFLPEAGKTFTDSGTGSCH